MDRKSFCRQEVELKELILAIFLKWRIILISMVIGAVLFGTYKGVTGFKEVNDNKIIEIKKNEYEEAMAEFEYQKLLIESEIDRIQREIKQNKEYIDNSILMGLDTSKLSTIKTRIFVKTEEAIGDENNLSTASEIIAIYRRRLLGDELWGRISEEVGINKAYLRELVSVGTVGDIGIEISMLGFDEALGSNIKQILLDDLDGYYEQCSKITEKHEIFIEESPMTFTTNTSLREKQHVRFAEANELQSELISLEANLIELQKPVLKDYSNKSVIKPIIKYVVAGGVVGGMLLVAFICFFYLTSDKLHSERTMSDNFGIDILGCIDNVKKEKLNFIDKTLQKFQGKTNIYGKDIFRMIALNIRTKVKDSESMAVISMAERNIEDEAIAKMKETFTDKIEVVNVADISFEMWEDMLKFDNILFIVQREKTSLKLLQEYIHEINLLDRKIIGSIVY